VSTVRKSHSRMLAACARRNSAQLVSSRFGAGSIPASFRIAQTVLAASLTPSPTSSPWTRRYPPIRVLLCGPHDQLADLLGCRGPTRAPMRIRPATRDQLPMPAQNRPRPHEQRSFPRRSRQHAAQRRQKRPIRTRQLRTSNLTLQHRQLVPEQQDLDLLLPLRTKTQHH
jgi:hypothetical protein